MKLDFLFCVGNGLNLISYRRGAFTDIMSVNAPSDEAAASLYSFAISLLCLIFQQLRRNVSWVLSQVGRPAPELSHQLINAA